MKIYKLCKQGIKILDKSSFNPKHILECGQMFAYDKDGEDYIVFPGDKFARIAEDENGYTIITSIPKYFVKFFDLDRDYGAIKKTLSEFEMMKKPIEFGYGIRLLNQDLFEMLISFLLSQNNNIKRIQRILNNLRRGIGKQTAHGHAFPTYEDMLKQDIEFFYSIGAGYRANYLFEVLRQITPKKLEEWRKLDTPHLLAELLSLTGVGPKVADCIMLFGYGRSDVCPVDTWIHKMYNTYFPPCNNRDKIRKNLLSQFGELTGFAQQYLFYYQRCS